MYEYRATVVRWVDGDTVDLNVDLGFRVATQQRFRLLGVDTPERGEPGYDAAREIADAAAPAGSQLSVQTVKSDKYGRWLVDLAWVREALTQAGFNKLAPAAG